MQGGDKEAAATVTEKDAVPYDFRLPNRISKIQLRTLRNIHENFAESLSSFLMTKLQSIINVNVLSVDQIYYSEYVLSVSSPACLFTFELRDTDIKGILEVSIDLAYTLVDKLLGGSGKGGKQAKIITPIEQKVLYIFADKVMQDLKKTWQIIGNYDFQIERFESDIDFAQITSQSESVLLISFEIYIGEQPFLMNLCFATYAFDIILSKLTGQNYSVIRPMKYSGTTAKNIIAEHLQGTYLPVMVEFGKARISFKDLMKLRDGDVLIMDKKVGEELRVKVANKQVFLGLPGTVNGKKALKITKRIEREEP
jgi:flagellar motor switch protein FliM